MWFQVELAEPAQVTEVQFESVSSGQGRGGGRGAPGAAPGAPAPAPIIGYPRAYDVQVSMDGKKWTKVASGQGSGSHTSIDFAPTQAKFVRITQTDNIQDAPAWSIRSLRVSEAKAK
jgi:hypothetical protein